jgi:cysteinyl-tRNA synthetase, unknown class
LKYKGEKIVLKTVKPVLVIIVFMMFLAVNAVSSQHQESNNVLLYWINGPDIEKIARTDFKYVIMDYSRHGDKESEFSSEDIKKVRESLQGGRIVLCYLSIGEAEDYRFYWSKDWRPDPSPPHWKGNPSFLGPENPDWEGNYIVNYSDRVWKQIVFEYLDRIISQGFDGVYLDIVDGYQNFKNDKYREKPSREDMENFVIEISRYGKSKKPGFRIFVQNAEELVLLPDSKTLNRTYLNAVDGIGREDTFYYRGIRKPETIERITQHLDKFKSAGKVVFTIDYPPLDNKELVNWCHTQARSRGYIQYVGPLELDRIFNQP